jgi:hypothetical protein
LVALVAIGAGDSTTLCRAATNSGPTTSDAVSTMLWNEISSVVFSDSLEHADHYVFYVSYQDQQDPPAGLLEALPSFQGVEVFPLSQSDHQGATDIHTASGESRYVDFIRIESPVMMGTDSCVVHYTVQNGEPRAKTMTLIRQYDLWQVKPKLSKSGSGC